MTQNAERKHHVLRQRTLGWPKKKAGKAMDGTGKGMDDTGKGTDYARKRMDDAGKDSNSIGVVSMN